MKLVDHILLASRPRLIDEAKTALSAVARGMGFDQFSYIGGRAFRPTTGGKAIWHRPPKVLITFPGEWIGLYHSRDLLNLLLLVLTVYTFMIDQHDMNMESSHGSYAVRCPNRD